MRRQTSLAESKSVLAKLMAAENLMVMHENITTAFFDLETRTLHCPIWQDMNGALYDLVMGHEIGHALYTPKEGWHDSIIAEGMKFKTFINVCEDVRIEKLIKRKFPGLKRCFAEAYKNLFDRDFFGIKGLESLDQLNLIDRINVFFKVGAYVRVEFTAEEQQHITALENAETFEDALAIARVVYGYVKEKEQDKINSKTDLSEQIKQDQEDKQDQPAPEQEEQADGSSESEEDDEDQEESEDEQAESDEEDDEESGESTDSDTDEQEDDTDSDDSETESGESGDESEESDEDDSEAEDDEVDAKDGESGDDHAEDQDVEDQDGGTEDDDSSDDKPETEPESITDRNFRDNESQLVDQTPKAFVGNVTLPEPVLSNIIIKTDKVLARFERGVETNIPYSYKSTKSYHDLAQAALTHYTKKNKNGVDLLFKEFMMRKNATQYAREQTHRTGALDTRRLARYHTTNDIFRRITEVPQGKNHGMIMFIDMSQSMTGKFMYGAMEQTLTLTMFCNKAQIPFDVYGFCDNRESSYSTYPSKFSADERALRLDGDLVLRHMISSRDSSGTQKRSLKMLALYCAMMYRSAGLGEIVVDDPVEAILRDVSAADDCGLGLTGTPLKQTIIASRRIIEEFKATTRVDITNVIYLTDGDGNDGHQLPQPQLNWDSILSGILVTDPVTRRQKMMQTDNLQSQLLEFVRELTGCRHIGFYICDAHTAREYARGDGAVDEVDKRYKSINDYGFFSASRLGFDNYYYMTDKYMGYESKELLGGMNTNDSKKILVKSFNDDARASKASRVVLSQFAQEISTMDEKDRESR